MCFNFILIGRALLGSMKRTEYILKAQVLNLIKYNNISEKVVTSSLTQV